MTKSTKTTNEAYEKVESSSFELKLPDDLNPKPAYIVPLPRNKQAMIYEVQVPEEKDKVSHTRYDVYLVSAKSFKSNGDYRYGERCTKFTDIPAIKHYLYDVVAFLSIKKKTRKIVDVVDLQDADDDE